MISRVHAKYGITDCPKLELASVFVRSLIFDFVCDLDNRLKRDIYATHALML
jgi:hypothetical protein